MSRPIENHEILDMIELVINSQIGIIVKSNLKVMLLELFERRTKALPADLYTCKMTKSQKLAWEANIARYTVLKMEHL